MTLGVHVSQFACQLDHEKDLVVDINRGWILVFERDDVKCDK